MARFPDVHLRYAVSASIATLPLEEWGGVAEMRAVAGSRPPSLDRAPPSIILLDNLLRLFYILYTTTTTPTVSTLPRSVWDVCGLDGDSMSALRMLSPPYRSRSGGGDRDHRAVTDHCCWPTPSIVLLDHLLWFLLRYDSTHTTRDTATLHLAIAPPLSLSPYLCASTV